MSILITDRAVFTTREISIRCAHCQGRHGSVDEVRNCAYDKSPLGQAAQVKFEPVKEPGMYRTEGDVYLVVRSEKGNLYAKKLVTTMHGTQVHKLTFEYDKGSVFKIQSTDRMTLADVAALGKTTGHCWICTRKLTVQKSIAAGIGPVCAKRV